MDNWARINKILSFPISTPVVDREGRRKRWRRRDSSAFFSRFPLRSVRLLRCEKLLRWKKNLIKCWHREKRQKFNFREVCFAFGETIFLLVCWGRWSAINKREKLLRRDTTYELNRKHTHTHTHMIQFKILFIYRYSKISATLSPFPWKFISAKRDFLGGKPTETNRDISSPLRGSDNVHDFHPNSTYSPFVKKFSSSNTTRSSLKSPVLAHMNTCQGSLDQKKKSWRYESFPVLIILLPSWVVRPLTADKSRRKTHVIGWRTGFSLAQRLEVSRRRARNNLGSQSDSCFMTASEWSRFQFRLCQSTFSSLRLGIFVWSSILWVFSDNFQ